MNIKFCIHRKLSIIVNFLVWPSLFLLMDLHRQKTKYRPHQINQRILFSDQPPLIEGDIIDDDDTRYKMEQAANGGASAFDALQGGKWPNGVVPYKFGSVGKHLFNISLKDYSKIFLKTYELKACQINSSKSY